MFFSFSSQAVNMSGAAANPDMDRGAEHTALLSVSTWHAASARVPPSNRRVTAEHTTSTMVPASTSTPNTLVRPSAGRTARDALPFVFATLLLNRFGVCAQKTCESDPACNLVFSLTHCFCFGYAGHPG